MINWERVRELQSDMGAEDFREVVALFLEEVEDVLMGLDAGPAAGAMEAPMHFLRGSALNLGFSDLAALCTEGEKLAAQGRGGQIDLAAIHAAYQAAKAAFLAAEKIEVTTAA
jgi:HPt (histidine-containing phosphotransfer) domain-containing protein